MKLPQKTYEKRVNSGLRPFVPIKSPKDCDSVIQSKQVNSSQRTLADFLKYFLVVFVVVAGLAGFLHQKRQSAEKLAQNQADIDKYAALLKPLPPLPSPTPTAIPQPVTITRLPPKVSPPTYTPPIENPFKKPEWAKSAAATPNYSPNYDSSGYSSSYSPSSGDKTVSVSGYYRKNGTYVSPYMRRAPRR